jgi:3-phenylpropionate/trans-cinnamate dioxygenase ferredoxin subunit
MPRVIRVSVAEDELTLGAAKPITVEGREIVVCRTSAGIFAVDNICTHAYARLSGGRLRGTRLICPLHGASFDVCDGRVLGAPATQPLPTHPVRVEGGRIEISVEIPDVRPLHWG